MKASWALSGTLCFLALALLATSAFGMAPGDINRDGEVGVSDVQCMVLAIMAAAEAPPECMGSMEASDLDCSGSVNVGDVQLASRLALGVLNQVPGLPEAVDGDRDNVHDACDINPDYFDPEQSDRDTLATLWCGGGEMAKWSEQSEGWACAPDLNTQLDEAAVDLMVANNGYLTDEIDPKVGELSSDKWCRAEGGKVVCNQLPPVGLDEAQVDFMVANNGFATQLDLQVLDAATQAEIQHFDASLAQVAKDGAFSSLTGIPEGLTDGDNDSLMDIDCLDGQAPFFNAATEQFECRALSQSDSVHEIQSLQAGATLTLQTENSTPPLIAQAWVKNAAGKILPVKKFNDPLSGCAACGDGANGAFDPASNPDPPCSDVEIYVDQNASSASEVVVVWRGGDNQQASGIQIEIEGVDITNGSIIIEHPGMEDFIATPSQQNLTLTIIAFNLWGILTTLPSSVATLFRLTNVHVPEGVTPEVVNPVISNYNEVLAVCPADSTASGEYNFEGGEFNIAGDVHIPASMTLNVTGAQPLVIRSTGSIVVDGAIIADGADATEDVGGAGGNSGGGQSGGTAAGSEGSSSQAGWGTGGGAPGTNLTGNITSPHWNGAQYVGDIEGTGGRIASNGAGSEWWLLDDPLNAQTITGGGGGGAGDTTAGGIGGGGGAGGGVVILIAQNSIHVNGTIRATGGSGGDSTCSGTCYVAGSGAGGGGGGVILRATSVDINGTLDVTGGAGGCLKSYLQFCGCNGESNCYGDLGPRPDPEIKLKGQDGIIRIDSHFVTGSAQLPRHIRGSTAGLAEPYTFGTDSAGSWYVKNNTGQQVDAYISLVFGL